MYSPCYGAGGVRTSPRFGKSLTLSYLAYTPVLRQLSPEDLKGDHQELRAKLPEKVEGFQGQFLWLQANIGRASGSLRRLIYKHHLATSCWVKVGQSPLFALYMT